MYSARWFVVSFANMPLLFPFGNMLCSPLTPSCAPEGDRTAPYQRDMCAEFQRWPRRVSYGASRSQGQEKRLSWFWNEGFGTSHGDLEATAEMMGPRRQPLW